MLFNSWGYILFLALIVPSIWLCRSALQRQVIYSVASFVFYAMWRLDFALLVVFSALVDFIASSQIAHSKSQRHKRAWLGLSLTINLGLLVVFKYSKFIFSNLSALKSFLGGQASTPLWIDTMILPLGISFYTFQTISYTIDVYRGVTKPTANFITFLAYVMFWPQLVAGPILRAGEVIPALKTQGQFDANNLKLGLEQIARGLFKKVVLADSIAPAVERIFAVQADYLLGIDVWAGTILFGFQIYFDFSAYSDIAIGSARLIGFEFPQNFNWPYISKSPREFWSRWHISLGSWIRDYLYIPLTGAAFKSSEQKSEGGIGALEAKDESEVHQNRKPIRTTRALWLTWIIMGFWHGAGWNFALWGLYHAATILLWRKLSLLRNFSKEWPVVATLCMFGIAMLGWIPFRADSASQALTYFGTVVNPLRYGLDGHKALIYDYALGAALTVSMFALAILRAQVLSRFGRLTEWLSPVFHGFLFAASLIMLQQQTQFIYFQF